MMQLYLAKFQLMQLGFELGRAPHPLGLRAGVPLAFNQVVLFDTRVDVMVGAASSTVPMTILNDRTLVMIIG